MVEKISWCYSEAVYLRSRRYLERLRNISVGIEQDTLVYVCVYVNQRDPLDDTTPCDTMQ